MLTNKRRVFPSAKILVIDDHVENIHLLRELLDMLGYDQVTGVTDPTLAVEKFKSLSPDLILLDLHLGEMSGVDVLRQIQPLIGSEGFVPTVVLTCDHTGEMREAALASGAIDFILKPFAASEVGLRIGNLLQMRHLHLELEAKNESLERKVRERTRDLEDAYSDLVDRLARAAEYRDDETGQHTQRVGAIAERISRELGMPESDAVLIGKAALLHDLGKIGIPDSILLKPTKLSVIELAEMHTHVEIGASILSNSRSCLLKMAEVIALNHHERWNGSGYIGLSGEEIPLPGRIVALADVFDALMSERPYKAAWTFDEAQEEIEKGRGTQFDPAVVDAFLRVVDSVKDEVYTEDSYYRRAAKASAERELASSESIMRQCQETLESASAA